VQLVRNVVKTAMTSVQVINTPIAPFPQWHTFHHIWKRKRDHLFSVYHLYCFLWCSPRRLQPLPESRACVHFVVADDVIRSCVLFKVGEIFHERMRRGILRVAGNDAVNCKFHFDDIIIAHRFDSLLHPDLVFDAINGFRHVCWYPNAHGQHFRKISKRFP